MGSYRLRGGGDEGVKQMTEYYLQVFTGVRVIDRVADS